MPSSDLEANHYEALAIAPDASQEDVNRAYKARLLVVHPDKIGASGSAPASAPASALARVREAYHVLRDPASRAEYDESLRSQRMFEDAMDVYDEMLRSELEISDDGTLLTHQCRCGDVFALGVEEEDAEYILECPSCSLRLRVAMG